jgi:hypothetical protein
MNLRRGLMRLWIVGSVGWVIAVLIYHYHRGCYLIDDGLGCRDPNPNNWPYVVTWLEFVGWMVAIPVLSLAAGLGLSWAVAGFRRQSSN